MDKRNTSPATGEKTFDTLVRFEAAELSPLKLYANGRQQVWLEVLIEATLEGEPVDLTQPELDSIRLVHYNTGEELSDDWTFSQEPNEYYFYPDAVGVESSTARVSQTEAKGRHVIQLYVSTVDSVAASRKLALAMTRNDGLVAITDARDVEPSWGKQNDVTLQPVRPPTYLIDNYPFEKTILRETPFASDADRRRDDGGSPIFVAYYYMGLVGNNGEPIGFKYMDVQEGGMIQWHDKVPAETFASYTGYGKPGSNIAIYNKQIILGGHVPDVSISHPIADRGTIILVGDVNIPFHADSAKNHGGPCRVTAIDVYGNDHELNIKFKDATPQGRFDLVLFK